MTPASDEQTSFVSDTVPAMSDADFAALGRLVRDQTGIVLNESKRWMLTSRLSREIRRLGLTDFASYRRLLEHPDAAAELQALTSAVTTNVTSFFRGPDHFHALAEMIPDFKEKLRRGGRVRIWSAGCSTGQEPYSIAMTLMSEWPEAASVDLRVLATDIDAEVISTARSGVYPAKELEGADTSLLRRFARPGPQPGTIEMLPDLRQLVRFEQLNMLGHWPFNGSFDVIFCRNVVIYFDAETRHRLWERFASRLEPEGWLFVGHSERIDRSLETILRPSGVTRYKRCSAAASPKMPISP